MSLTPNTAAKRFEYIAKLYGDQHPDVMLDTFMVLADTVGIERTWSKWSWARKWDSMGFGARGNSGQAQRLMLHDARRDLATEPQMQRRHASDPLWPWLARELVRLKQEDARSGDGHRPLGAVLASTDVSEGGLRGLGPALALWQRQNKIDLGQWRLLDAMKAVEEFEAERKVIPQGDVVYEWPDGWTMQLLVPPNELREESEAEYEEALANMLDVEGDVMQHCVGGDDYGNRALHGDIEIYSLRDPKGRPHVTIEAVPELRRILQVQGKQNRAPLPEYRARVDEWATHEGLLSLDQMFPDEVEAAEEFGAQAALERLEEYLAREHTSVMELSWSDVEVLGREFLHGEEERKLLEHVYGSEAAERHLGYGFDELWDELWKVARRAAERAYNERRSELLEQTYRLATDIADRARPNVESDTWDAEDVDEFIDAELALLGPPWGGSDREHIEREVWRKLSDAFYAQRERQDDRR